MSNKLKKDNRRIKADFLNEYFFPNATGYEAKEVGKWILVRQWQTDHWVVAIWSKEAYQKSQDYYHEHQQSLIEDSG